MYEEFSLGGNEENTGRDTVDETIIHVQELLDNGLYDKEVHDEAILMLNTARLSTRDQQAIDQIDILLADIESRYEKNRNG